MQLMISQAKKNFSPIISDWNNTELAKIKTYALQAFENIAPFWPLKNLIAVNPLQGFENISFDQALEKAMCYFQQNDIPAPLEDINRETIKWCQAFFDEGQAAIEMPFRQQGLYSCFKCLASHDRNLKQLSTDKISFLHTLPVKPEQAILMCLKNFKIPSESYEQFLLLMLTTLPGWASYVCYRTKWSDAKLYSYPVTRLDYLAVRVVLTFLIYPKEIDLSYWYNQVKFQSKKKDANNLIKELVDSETRYQDLLLRSLEKNKTQNNIAAKKAKAQLVFCIDVRSEPFRRAVEAQGNYQTFGFAGFFGVPVQIKNELSEGGYASCPVLLSPKHCINENLVCSEQLKNKVLKRKERIKIIKYLYCMLKYMFATPFTLVEMLGLWSGLWMFARTTSPIASIRFKKRFLEFSPENLPVTPLLENIDNMAGISFLDQCLYAENFLRMIGLTKEFSPLVVLCAHGASTENNAYHSALDCGACGGQNGAPNARILAAILNQDTIRNYLAEKSINIPNETIFIPALHNTTTDEIKFYDNENLSHYKSSLDSLKYDLILAREKNNYFRAKNLSIKDLKSCVDYIKRRSADWAQTRPEWGLARNAAFIVGPRDLTKNINLDGRVFLHSYDWVEDEDGALLTTILTAPMVVAQWINYQYLFSVLDNVAYGSGSKITHNITSKIGAMQGNASDLMHGLPLQSVCKNDHERYHEPLRLLTVVYAPRLRIENIISKQQILQKLFKNSWVHLNCWDPSDNMFYSLTSNLNWKRYQL